MDCRTIQHRIRDGAAVAASPGETRELEAHLARCADCRALLEPGFDLEAAAPPADLLETVLRETTGPVCATARERLCDDLDGGLEALDAELVRAHADACDDCGSLRAVLTELGRDLRGMQELAPDRGFTTDVLGVTSHGAWRPLAARLADVWNRLYRRPRFAWEAAYVGAMLFWLVLGAPLDALSGTPGRILDALPEMTRSSAALGSLRGNISELGRRSASSARSACSTSIARIGSGITDGTQKAQQTVDGIRRQGAELGDALRALDVGDGGDAVKTLTREFVNKLVTEDNDQQE